MEGSGFPFEVVGPLGRGGIADVYEVRVPGEVRSFAAKVLRRADAGTLARFEREGEVAARLRHPHIVPVHTTGALPDGTRYLLMDLIEGENLGEALERGALPVPRVVALGIALGEALVHAHAQGVVHRDVKPGNILLTKTGVPHLTDFGIARVFDMEALTQTGFVVGTPAYMAPEQVEGGDIGPAADVYALGAVLYEALLGRPPLELPDGPTAFPIIRSVAPEPVAQHRGEVPRAVSDLLARCLAKDPSARPDAPQLVATLREAQRRLTSVGGDSSSLKLLGFAVALGGLAAVGLAVGLSRGADSKPPPAAANRAAKTDAGGPAATAPKRYDLTMQAKVGDPIRISFHVKRQAPLERSMILVRLRGRVRAIDGDWIVVPGRIEAMKIDLALAQETHIRFDSSKSPAQDMPTMRALRGMIGVEARISIHRKTGEYRVRGYQDAAHAIVDKLPLTFEDLKRTLRQAFVENGINVARRVYPGRPVALGEEWIVPFDIWFSKRKARGSRRCVLERGPGGALRIRVVGLEPNFTWENQPEGLTRVTMEGETLLDREESRLELSFYKGKHRFRTVWTWTRTQ